MDRYKYVAIDPKSDRVVRKEVTAKSRQEVESIIESQKLEPVMIQVVKTRRLDIKFGQKVSRLEKISLTNELSIMLKSGISIVDSIDIIKEGMRNSYLIEILEGVKYSVQSGNSLSAAFKSYPDVFDEIFLAMIEAGEDSGKLSQALSSLSSEIKRDHRLVQDVTGALIYPAVILSTLILISLGMFVFVVPKVASVYESLAVKLPLPTKIFLAIGVFSSEKWWLLIPVIVILAVFFWWGLKSKRGQLALGAIQRRIPIMKHISALFNYVRFARILSILLGSGVQINTSVKVAARGLTDPALRTAGRSIAKQVEEGISLAEAMRKEEVFPITMVKMIEVGEKSGNLETILKDLSGYYSEELKDRLGRFTSLIEPILVVVIGFAIGAMVISLIGPIYGIIGQLEQ